MKFKARLNFKFYIVFILLLGIVALGWYGLYFLNINEILMEDNTPMDNQTKMLFTVAIGVVTLSWTFSLLTVVRQILLGCAFIIDEKGIHKTATAINVFAFIFVTPIKTIPFSAIEKITDDNGLFTLYIDKSKIDTTPIFRFLVRKTYHLCQGFTVENQEVIKYEFEKFLNIEEIKK